MSYKLHRYLLISLLLFFTAALLCRNVLAIQVFPGAMGYGTDTRAAYGDNQYPTIFIVNNLSNEGGSPENSTRNGVSVKTGSFRQAVEYDKDNKFIIFEVSGTIPVDDRLVVDNDNVSILGQTAPPPGITLRGCVLQLSGDDILVQHIRVRVGDGKSNIPYYSKDGINIDSFVDDHPYNVVVDHCSVSWAMDENVGVGNQDYLNDPILNATVSNCIIAEPLEKYEEDPEHTGKNFLVGRGANNATVINNIMAHARDRNPFVAYGWNRMVVANNLIFNPGDFNINLAIGRDVSEGSFVGNVVIGGRNTSTTAREMIPNFNKDPWPGTRFFMLDNRVAAGVQEDENDWSLVRNNTGYTDEELESAFKATSPPVWPSNYTVMASELVIDTLLKSAGAFPNYRDAVDERIIDDIINGSGTFITSQDDVGGFPNLATNSIEHNLPSNPHGDDDNDGYTNLEEWVHQITLGIEKSISTPQSLHIK